MQGGGMGGPGIRGYENGGGEPERMARGIERPPYREDPYYVSPGGKMQWYPKTKDSFVCKIDTK